MAIEIPVSSIVNVSISTTPQAPTRKGFGTALLLTSEAPNATGLGAENPLPNMLVQGVRYFQTIDDVKAVYDSSTEAYKAAQAFFGQSPKPNRPNIFGIAQRFTANTSAVLEGGANEESVIANWQAITAGSMTVTVNGITSAITALNFSSDTTLTQVASRIQTAIIALAGNFADSTFTHDGTRFVFKNDLVAPTGVATIGFMGDHTSGTPIASHLKMKQGEGTKVNAIAAETVTAALNRAQTASDEWYILLMTKETRDTSAVTDAAAWVEARIKQFFTISNSEDCYDASKTTDQAYLLNAAGYRRTFSDFHGYPAEYPDASAAGRVSTVDFDASNSTITLKFKQLPGITANRLTSSQMTNLTAKGCNAYVVVGGVPMLTEGIMAAGMGVFQDTIHGVDWLQNAIESEVFARLYQETKKVPYTDAGAAIIEQKIVRVLDQAVKNGFIAPGYDLDGKLYPEGYEVLPNPVRDATASQRTQRQYPPFSFTAIGAGAIHGVSIVGTVNA